MASYGITTNLFGCKIETTPGTEETLTSADYDVSVDELTMAEVMREMADTNKKATGDHTKSTNVPGIASGGLGFSAEIARGDFNYNAASLESSSLPLSKVLQASGLLVTVSDPTDEATEDGYWEFTPNLLADIQPMTMAFIEKDHETGNGKEFKMYGAMSSYTLELETGKPWKLAFDPKGGIASDGVKDIPAASLPEFIDANANNNIPEPYLETTVTLTELNEDGTVLSGGTVYSACADTATLDPQHEVSAQKCQSGTGIKNMSVTKRDEKLTLNMRLMTQTDLDFWAAIGNASKWKIELVNSSQSLTVPMSQMLTMSHGDIDGWASGEMEFDIKRNVAGTTQAEREAVYSMKINGYNKDVTP